VIASSSDWKKGLEHETKGTGPTRGKEHANLVCDRFRAPNYGIKMNSSGRKHQPNLPTLDLVATQPRTMKVVPMYVVLSFFVSSIYVTLVDALRIVVPSRTSASCSSTRHLLRPHRKIALSYQNLDCSSDKIFSVCSVGDTGPIELTSPKQSVRRYVWMSMFATLIVLVELVSFTTTAVAEQPMETTDSPTTVADPLVSFGERLSNPPKWPQDAAHPLPMLIQNEPLPSQPNAIEEAIEMAKTKKQINPTTHG
jgi:hypothetical protein